MGSETLGAGVRGRVSVIMPCYNVRGYVAEALESVESQAGTDVEVNVADDGSTDGTRELLAEWANSGRVRAIFLPKRRVGPYALRNECIRRSTGEYIAFLDADDYWTEGKLSRQVAALEEEPAAGLCHARLVRTCESQPPRLNFAKSNVGKYNGDCFHALLASNCIGTSSVIVRRDVFERVGLFDERFRFNGDWEMWARIARLYRVVLVDEPLVYYRVHAGAISARPSNVRQFAFAILDTFEAEYGLTDEEVRSCLEPARANLNFEFAMASLVERNLTDARTMFLAALRHKWMDPRLWIGLAKTLLYRQGHA